MVPIERSFQGLSVAIETVRIDGELMEIWPNEVCDSSEKNLLTPTSIYTASGIVNVDLLRVRRLGLVGYLEKNTEYTQNSI